jgi:hypothetical protein
MIFLNIKNLIYLILTGVILAFYTPHKIIAMDLESQSAIIPTEINPNEGYHILIDIIDNTYQFVFEDKLDAAENYLTVNLQLLRSEKQKENWGRVKNKIIYLKKINNKQEEYKKTKEELLEYIAKRQMSVRIRNMTNIAYDYILDDSLTSAAKYILQNLQLLISERQKQHWKDIHQSIISLSKLRMKPGKYNEEKSIILNIIYPQYIRYQNEVQEENKNKLIKLTQKTLSIPENEELSHAIMPSTGIICVVSFNHNQCSLNPKRCKPRILQYLSATALSDKKVLTAFHAVDLLIKSSKEERIFLFFIPSYRLHYARYNLDNQEENTRDYEKPGFWDSLPKNKYKLPETIQSMHSVHQINYLPLEFSKFYRNIEIVIKKLMENGIYKNELEYDEGFINFISDEENRAFSEFINDGEIFYLVNRMINPNYKIRYNAKSLNGIDWNNDIAVCDVTNSSLLPKNNLNLVLFNRNNINCAIDLKNSVEFFIASSRYADNAYLNFFVGGITQMNTSNMKIIGEGIFEVPVSQIKGCSGGALIIAPPKDSNGKYILSDIKIIGVDSQGPSYYAADQSIFCPWVLEKYEEDWVQEDESTNCSLQ